MRDGYYLSTYIEINKIGNLNAYGQRHDYNISLWHKTDSEVDLIHYWELERITGNKQHRIPFYDLEQAKAFINSLLEQYKINLDDIVEVWGTPQLLKNNDYNTYDKYEDYAYHSIWHMFSSLLFDSDKFNKDTIMCFAVDGGPDSVLDIEAYDKYFYSGCLAQNGKIIDMFPAFSPGLLWEFASNKFKLKEGTLMALGSACNCEAYIPKQEDVLISGNDSVSEANVYLEKLISQINNISAEDEGILFNGFDNRFTIEENKISMAVKEIQKMSFSIMDENITNTIKKYGIDPKNTYLALSGGYVLNCPTNSYLMNKYEFKGFIAPPCVSDTGMSLGIALHTFYTRMDKLNFKMKHAYYGDSDYALSDLLSSGLYSEFIKSVSEFDANKAVEDIKESPIVWFNGAAEVGPRALGNRSIIADPRYESSKDKLNIVKQRQWWRPVAPIILEDEINEWFEDAYSSPFMLNTFEIKKDKEQLIPAVAHLDKSSRVQTINSDTNKILYNLLKAFKENTGVPILCNTSLNDRGEPIINKIEEALNFALRKNINVIYINGTRIELKNHNKYLNDKPLARNKSMEKSEREIQLLIKEVNPHNVPKDVLFYYLNMHKMQIKYDITNKDEARELAIQAKMDMKKSGVSEFIPTL